MKIKLSKFDLRNVLLSVIAGIEASPLARGAWEKN
jgi:hypothetical protein